MQSVSHLLESKGHQIWSVTPTSSVYDAIALMAEKRVGALMVLDGNAPVGIVSERDYARKVILEGRSSKQTPVEDIMTRQVVFARVEQSIDECMALMTEKRIRHLPVVEGEKLVGIISIGDLVRVIIEEQGYLIEQLESYISS